MKTKFYMIATAIVAMAMTSCDNAEKDLYDPDAARDQEYVNAFTKEFGAIPNGQSWDYYASAIESIRTRAAGDATIDNTIGQPEGMDFTQWQYMLDKNADNRNVGAHDFQLVSNGAFKVYAVWYSGQYEVWGQHEFELGVYYNDEYTKIFDGCGQPRYAPYPVNPGLGANVDIPKGQPFQFYIKYVANSHPYYAFSGPGESSTTAGAAWSPVYSYGNASLLFSDLVTPEKQVMVIGFEDKMRMDWSLPGKSGITPDCSDVILYIEGNPNLPVPEAKRFMCEDQGSIGDFDFNDVVFDVHPGVSNTAEVILRAAGGTLPIDLIVAGQNLGEVHELLGVSTGTMVNTGIASAEPYTTTVTIPSDFDLTTFTDVKLQVTAKDGSKYVLNYSEEGSAPCFIATPISTRWMKETKNIKLGYPSFFGEGWYENSVPEFLQ